MVRWLSKVLAVFSLAFVSLVMVPASASAAYDPFEDVCNTGGGNSTVCETAGGDGDPISGSDGAIVNVTSILSLIVGFVSVAFVVWGGFKYITSNGDSAGVSTAKNTIIAALVGLVIALMARPLILFVVGKL